MTETKIPRWLPLLLGFLSAVGPVSTDMYLPAFPAIAADLQGSPQITLFAWLIGLACGQLLQGALADRFGRRTPILVGTLVYILGTIGCAMAPSIAALSALRVVTAIGASASMVIPRAIVRDISHGHAAARLMSRLILVLGAGPILAPSIGGLVLRFTGWRGIFWVNATYGAICLLLAWWKLPDTLPVRARVPFHLLPMLRRYAHILTERSFVTHALMMTCFSFGTFAYLGGSPGTFIGQYGFSPPAYGAIFGVVAGSYILCSQINIFAVRRFGLNGTLHRAATGYLMAACLLLALAALHAPAPVFVVVLALTHCFNGFATPSGMAGALHHHAAHAGSASAVLGTLQFALGSSSSIIVGLLPASPAIAMTGLICVAAMCAKLCDLCRPHDDKARKSLLF